MKTDIITEYQPLVNKLVAMYKKTGIPTEDLTQEAMIGLLEAEKKYDPDKGASFATYATYWIKNKILSYISAEYKQQRIQTKDMQALQEEDEPLELNSEELKRDVSVYPQDMPDIEKQVLNLYFNKKMTLKDISQELNIKRERVRQIKNMALRRYKKVKDQEKRG